MKKDDPSRQVTLLEDLLITQLLLAKVPQATVRQIVGVEMVRVARIGKYLKAANPTAKRKS